MFLYCLCDNNVEYIVAVKTRYIKRQRIAQLQDLQASIYSDNWMRPYSKAIVIVKSMNKFLNRYQFWRNIYFNFACCIRSITGYFYSASGALQIMNINAVHAFSGFSLCLLYSRYYF